MGTVTQERIDSLSVSLGGRVFVTSNKTTLMQDMYLWKALSEAKLDTLMQHYDASSDMLSGIGKQIVLQAYNSGSLFTVMGGVLIEKGTKWSKEQAEANAAFLEELDDEEDKKVVRTQMVAVVLHFFVSEAGLRAISLKSSVNESEEKASLANEFSGEQMISVSGTQSSENSQATIR